MKIIVSGWSGTGGTTLALILAKNLSFKLIRGTEAFRYLGKQLNLSDTGEGRFTADIYLEKHFGKVFDKYIDSILQDKSLRNIIIESDIAGFRIKEADVFSIFLTASEKVRFERLVGDNRNEDTKFLETRDKENAKFYKALHNIDWFDIDKIKDKYSFVLNNSKVSIAEELIEVSKELKKLADLNEAVLNAIIKNAKKEERLYLKEGKAWYINFLKENRLLTNAEDILREIKESFPRDISEFPTELKLIFDKI